MKSEISRDRIHDPEISNLIRDWRRCPDLFRGLCFFLFSSTFNCTVIHNTFLNCLYWYYI